MEQRFLDKETLKKFISENRLKETIKNLIFQINEFLDKNENHIDFEPIRQLSDALIINSGKLNGLEHDKTLGILDRKEQKITITEVQRSVLFIIDKLPEQFWNIQYPNIGLTYNSKLIKGVELQHEHENLFEYDLFFCYSTKDKDVAEKIWKILCGYGLRVFISNENLKNTVGANFLDKIDFALSKSKNLLLLASKNAFNSVYVRDEYQAFYSDFHVKNPEKRLIMIYLLADFKIKNLPRILKTKQIAKTPEQIISSFINENGDYNTLRQNVSNITKVTPDISTKFIEITSDKWSYWENDINKFEQGKVIELRNSKSIKIKGFNNLYIRIGQNKNFTILFRVDIATNKIYFLYEADNNWKLLKTMKDTEYFTPINIDIFSNNLNLSGSHFSILNDYGTFSVVNIGSKYGIYIQID